MSVRKHPSKKVSSVQKSVNEAAIIRQVSFVSILGNVVLTIFKLFAGIVGHSSDMVSDSIHSLSDVISTLIAFWGVRMSKKAADESHPYGHERIECVASLILGLLLMVTGIGIGKVGLQTILSGDYDTLVVPGAIALAAAVLSIVFKEAMFWYTKYYAKLLDSAAFMADAWHHRSDAFSSIGSLFGIGGAMLGFPVLDSVASVIICLCILKVAYDILKDALTKMLDTSCGEAYDQKLHDYIAAQEDVIGIDVLRSRMFGNKVYVDLEIEMDGSKTLRETHAVAERIHDNVEHDFPNVKHIMIHVNPAE